MTFNIKYKSKAMVMVMMVMMMSTFIPGMINPDHTAVVYGAPPVAQSFNVEAALGNSALPGSIPETPSVPASSTNIASQVDTVGAEKVDEMWDKIGNVETDAADQSVVQTIMGVLRNGASMTAVSDAINKLVVTYSSYISLALSILTLLVVGAFIYNVMLLGASSNDPAKRKSAINKLLVLFVLMACVGAFDLLYIITKSAVLI